MMDRARHIVIDNDFDRVLVDILRAFHEADLEIVARVDVREHFKRTLGRDFRRHIVFDVWSPDLALKALREDLELGTFLTTRFVIYELADGETVVAATEGLAPFLADRTRDTEHAALSALADREHERAARVLATLRRRVGSFPQVA